MSENEYEYFHLLHCLCVSDKEKVVGLLPLLIYEQSFIHLSDNML